MNEVNVLKKPSAWIPLALSLCAIMLIIVHVVIFGVTNETDEGTAAHIFQLLMVAQLPFVTVFIIRWLPQKPKQAIWVFISQAVLAMSAVTLVYFLT